MDTEHHTHFRSIPGSTILCLVVLLGLALVGLASPAPAEAATCTWTGATSTAWAVAGNWDCGAVPGANDAALIPNTTNKPVVTTGQSIGTLTIQSDGKVTVGASGVLTIVTAATVDGGGTLQLDTGTPVGTVYVGLAATLTINGTLDLSGVIRGEGAVTLAATSTFNWRRGGFGATAATPPGLTVTANGPVTIGGTGANATQVTYGTQLTTNGTVTWSGAYNMLFDQGAVITNNGTWDVRVSQTMDWQAGTVAVFTNNSTFTRSTSTGTFTVEATFNNSGTVNVNTGTLAVRYGGTSSTGSFYKVASGTTLNFGASSSPSTPGHVIDGTVEGAGAVRFWSGNATVSGPFNITGSTAVDPSGSSLVAGLVTMSNVTSLGNLALGNYGSLTIDGTASFTHNYNVTVSPSSGYKLTVNLPSFVVKGTYQQTGGTLTGTYAGGAVFEVQGTATLSAGTISGGGLTDKFKVSGALNLTPSVSVTFSGRTLETAGTTTWTGAGNLALSSAAVTNLAGATWDMRSDGDVTGSGSFNNYGTLRKSVGSVSPAYTGISPAFNNSGLVDLQQGRLALSGGGTSSGDFALASATSLLLTGAPTINGKVCGSTSGAIDCAAASTGAVSVYGSANVTFGAGGAYHITGGTTVWDTSGSQTATFQYAPTSLGPLTVGGTGTATIVFGAGAALTNTPVDLSNLAKLRITAGTFGVNGAATTVGSSAQIEVASGATLSSNNKVTLYGRILGGGTATLQDVDWYSGRLDSVQATVNGTLRLLGADKKYVYASTLTVAPGASAIWETTGNVACYGTSTAPGLIEVQGAWDFRNDADLDDYYMQPGEVRGTFRIAPGGLVQKTAGAGQTFVSIHNDNDGTVEIHSGELKLSGRQLATDVSDGVYRIKTGATLALTRGQVNYSHNIGSGGAIRDFSPADHGNVTFEYGSGAGVTVVDGEYDVSGSTTALSNATSNHILNNIVSLGFVNLPEANNASLTLNGVGRTFNHLYDIENHTGGVLTVNFDIFNVGTATNPKNYTQSCPNGLCTWAGTGIAQVWGTTIFNDGTIKGANRATDIFVANGPVFLDNATWKYLDKRTFETNAGLTFLNGSMRVTSATIHNGATGTWDFQCDCDIMEYLTIDSFYENDGIMGKSVGSMADQSEFETVLNNRGLVDLRQGVFNFRDMGGEGGTSPGDFAVADGTVLRLHGNHMISGRVCGNDDGAIDCDPDAVTGSVEVWDAGYTHFSGLYHITGGTTVMGCCFNETTWDSVPQSLGPLYVIDQADAYFTAGPVTTDYDVTLTGGGILGLNFPDQATTFTVNGTYRQLETDVGSTQRVGIGTLVIAGPGPHLWTGGDWYKWGKTVLGPGAVLNIDTNVETTELYAHTFENRGAVTYSGTYNLLLTSFGTGPVTIDNYGTWDIRTDADMYSGSSVGQNTLNNYGLFQRTAGSDEIRLLADVNNKSGGVFAVEAGSIRLINGDLVNDRGGTVIIGLDRSLYVGGTVTNNGKIQDTQSSTANEFARIESDATFRAIKYRGVIVHDAAMGQTTVTVWGNQTCTTAGVAPNADAQVLRCYEIDPPDGYAGTTDASFYYLYSERNGNVDPYAWHYNGNNWELETRSAKDNTSTSYRYVKASGLDSFGLFGLADYNPSNPHLLLTMTAAPTSFDTVGQVINFTLVAKNDGDVTLTNVTVSDPDLGTLTCTPSQPTTLAPGQSMTCTGSHVITQEDLDAARYDNSATASGSSPQGQVVSSTTSVSVTGLGTAHISLGKAASPGIYDEVGQVIDYTIVAVNDGELTLHDVTVSDPMFPSLSCTPAQGATLAPNTMMECQGSYTVTQEDLDRGTIDNTASTSGAGPQGQAVSAQASASVSAIQAPRLQLSKAANAETFNQAGLSIVYTIVAENTGNVTLHDVSISDPLLGALDCTPAQPAILAPGDTMTCTGTHVTTQVELNAGKVENTATVGGVGPANQAVSATASRSIPAIQTAHLALAKSPSVAGYDQTGQVIEYTLVATNDGNVTLTDVSIADPMFAVLNCAQPAVLAPGAALTCTGTRTTTQADLDAGKVDNTATASGAAPSGQGVSATASATVPATQLPYLTLAKTTETAGFEVAGQVIEYELVATNSGNVTLSNVTIADAKLGALTCTPGQPAELAPGQALTCIGSYTATQADLNAGQVNNSASAAGAGPQEQPVAASATKSVPAVQSPHLTLAKSANPMTFNAVGQEIVYTVVAFNDGNVTLSDVTITDALLGDLACEQPATVAPGGSLTCTGSHTVTQADLDAGSIANTANATATDPTGEDVEALSATVTATAGQSPHLSLAKTASPMSYDAAGQTIAYTVVATNDGNVTLHGVTIADATVGSLDCAQPATLAPGQSLTCTGSYAVTQADLNSGQVVNTADADASGPQDQAVSADASLTVSAVQRVQASLVKSADITSFDQAGDVIEYTLEATNTGNVTLAGVEVADPMFPELACTPQQPAQLQPGQTLTCTGSHTVTQADLNAGQVNNTATVTGTGPQDQEVSTAASKSIPATQAPHLALAKTASPTSYDAVGDVIAYSLVATNDGNVTLSNVAIVDPMLGTLDCTPALPAELEPGESVTCTASYTVAQHDLDAGSIANTANASGVDPTNTEVNALQATATATAGQQPHLSLSKAADTAAYEAVGQVIVYTMVATNDGNVTLSGVTVADPMFAALSCTPAQPAALAPGQSITCTASHTVTQAELDGASISNEAAAAGTGPAGQEVAANASVTVPATQSPQLALTKTAAPDTFEAAGQVVVYTLVATNAGNVTLTNVSISDPMFGSLECTPAQPASLAPGASLTCTGSHTTTQAELNAGQVNNTGTVSGTGPAGQVVTATAGKSVMAVQSPHLTLAKSANVTNYGTLGQVVEYTLVATNDGNVTLHGVSVDDPMFAELECLPEQPATLAPGASLACTSSYAITQADLDAGSLANTAGASAVDPLNQPVDSLPATATVTASQSPQLTLAKTVGAASYDHVGQVIAYSLVATNAGNVTLHDVAIADPKLGSLNCTPAQPAILAPGATLSCAGNYMVTQADLDAGTVNNAAAASATGPAGQVVAANASKSVPAAQQLSLTMTKSASLTSYDAVGQEIVYTLTATNDGNVTLDGVSIADPLFPELDCDPAQPAVLAPDETLTCTATYTIAQADIDAGSIANTARAAGSGPQNQAVESSQASVTVTAEQRPQLSLAKTAGPTAYDHIGQAINYTLVAENTGNVTLSGASISDPQLGVLDCLTEQPAALAPGESLTCTGSYAITQADLDAGRFTNTAAASGASPLGQGVSATASATVTGEGEPHLALSKSADTPAFDHVGQLVVYTLVATNDGDLTLYGVGISDPTTDLQGCGPATLGPGQALTCTGSHAVTQADLDAGRIDNTATASGSGPQQQPVSATASASAPGVQAPALTLSKAADKTSFDAAGVTIAYTLEATNAGNVTLHGVEIEDTLLGGMDCTPAQPAELAPGESIVCSGSYVTAQGDLNAGKVENTANASGVGPAGQPVSATASVTVPAIQAPHLALAKSADPASFDTLGQAIAYTLQATNDGNVTLHDVSIADPMFGSLSCTPAQPAVLAPGESMTCAASHSVTQAELDAGSLSNSAEASGKGPQDQPVAAAASLTIPAGQHPQLALTKTADKATFDSAGQVINYTLTAVNEGNVTLHGVAIADTMLGALDCTPAQPADLAPGGRLTCTGSHTVTQAEINAGKVDNTATATGAGPQDQPASAAASLSVPATQAPHLSLTKAASPTSYNAVGQVVAYTLVAINDGNVSLTEVAISDSMLGTLGCTPTQPATLEPGDSLICTGSRTATQADLDAGSIANTADASGKDPAGAAVSALSATATVSAAQSPHVTLTKSAGLTSYEEVGQVVEYTLVLTNDGNVTLHDAEIEDTLLSALTCTPSQPATLPPGGVLTCTGSHTVTQADLNAGQVNNTATASAAGPQDQPASATASKSIPATQSPHLSLAKSANATSYGAVGQVIEYTLVATNDGNVTLSGVEIADPLFAALECAPSQPAELAPGETLTCAAAHTITQADLDAGAITNTATAAGTDPTNATIESLPATVTVTAGQQPHLSLAKSASLASYDEVDQVVDYTLAATNDGNVTLHDVAIADPMFASLDCTPAQPAELAPGATLTCTDSYTITQTDLNSGKVDNTATATGVGPAGQPVSASASKSVPAAQAPHLALSKTADPTTYDQVGQVIGYALVAANDGNVTLDGVSIEDSMFAELNCTPEQPASLDPGEEVSCTASRTITQADLDAGSIANTANASATDPAGQPVDALPASATVTAQQRPQIALAKTADRTSYDAAGQVIHYTLVATNAGNVTLTGVSIADPTAGALGCEPAQPATLAVNGTITCTGSHTVTQDDLDAGKVDNTATATGSGPQGQPVSASATRSVPAAQTLHLALTKTADRTSYDAVGQVINYSLVVSNLSNVTLHGVDINDPALGTLSCTPALPATLTPNASVTCTGSHTVTQADLDAGSLRNTATASGLSPQNQPVASAPASVTVPAVQRPHITLTKAASPPTYDVVGQVIAYTLVATNDGNVTLSAVAIGDPKLGTLSCAPAQPATLAPGQTLTCTGSLTVNAADLINRKIENTASATGRGPLGQPVSASASAIATATAACSVQSSIVANFNGTAIAAGNTIWFNSVVTTTGRNTAQTTKVQFVNAAIRFTAGGVAYTLPAPDGVIVYSPSATQATTTVGTDGRWVTTVPASYTGNVFLAGLAYQVPTSLPGGIKNVTWSGTFVTPSSGINMSWKWAAAVYSTFTADPNQIGVKPIDGSSGNPYPNSDKAGTPENYKQYVTGGAMGGGGSNYTGSYSGTAGATCQAGDPRTPGYWGAWNRCSGGNQWKTAERNGGAAAGFYLLEDVLPQTVGNLTVSTCQVGVTIFNQNDLVTGQSKSDDAAFGLARHLLATLANFASWKKTCTAAQLAATNGQSLLVQVNFTGTGTYLRSGNPLYQQARDIQAQLDAYNNGNLCK